MLIAIEASHSMSRESDGQTRFEEALQYARALADAPLIFGYNSDWFLLEEPMEGAELGGSGLIAAAFRGGRELSRLHGISHLIIFTDGPDELEMPDAEARAARDLGLKVDIIVIGGDRSVLEGLDVLASTAGGRAILLDEDREPGSTPTPSATPPEERGAEPGPSGDAGGQEDETVIDISPKEEPRPEERSVKGFIKQLKEKVW